MLGTYIDIHQPLITSTLNMDIGQDQLNRVLELWFEDANVIFQAEGSLFRVHEGILQARSSVFHDMFALPQTTTPPESDLMDGCIVIQLPDAAEDIRCFFLAIGYDASSVSVLFGYSFLSYFCPAFSSHPLLRPLSVWF